MASVATATKPRKAAASNGKAGPAAAIMALALPVAFQEYHDPKKASAYVDETLSLYADVGERIHNAAVITAWHAVTHRNPALFNRFHAALRSNDQQALKLWVRRVQVTNGLILHGLIDASAQIPTKDTGGPLSGDTIDMAEETGSVLKFENKQFVIVANTVDAGKALAHLIEARWFQPQGEDTKVFVRSNIAEVNTFADADALAAVLRAANPKSTGRRDVVLNDKTTGLLQKIRDMVEPMLKQYQAQTDLSNGKA
jgi:hypothetical protein